ncbi:hypothetical protein ABPG75_010069 [Micractinium tetrahymenae]
MMPASPLRLSPLQPGPSLSLASMQQGEMPPITPLATDGDDASFCRRDRGVPTATRAAAGGSLLDLLLASALREVPAVQAGLPEPLLGPLPARAPAVTAAPAAPAAPGAPRRVGLLLPPPEIPADVLAALRPLRQPARRWAAPSAAGSSSGCSRCAVSDTATSRAAQLEL